MSPIPSVRERLVARLALIGADPRDDEDTRASKALLVLISVLILPVSLLWAALYLAFGSPVGWVPVMMVWLGDGKSCRILVKAGSMRFAGMIFPINGVRETGALAGPTVDNGS